MTLRGQLEDYDAVALADLVWRGEVEPGELCEASIRRIEELNPALNAVVTPMFGLARERIQDGLPNGPLRGVPMLLKDMLVPYTGVRYTKGARAYENHIAGHDSELLRRYEAAGMVVVGRTNTPEFALHATTEPLLHGPTRNPWSLEHSAGGSSGGSAAAVAAGMVPVATGNDMGGSIRIPASWCGLFGFKPSRGRNPTGPVEGEIWLGLGAEHVLTRTVRDSAAMLDLSCGEDPGAPYYLPAPEQSYLGAIQEPPIGLRVAFTTRSPVGTPVHLECIEAVEHTAHLLENLGHTVEEASPDVDGWAAAEAWLTICFSEVAAEIDRLRPILGRKARRHDVEPATWTMGLLGRAHTAAELNRAIEHRNRVGRIMGRFHQTYDILLTPTTATPPPRIGELGPRARDLMMVRLITAVGGGRLLKSSGTTRKLAAEGLAAVPFTQLANLAGQPAASLPLHWTPEGLPCGVMISAPIGDDETVLRLAAQVEAAKPWFDRRPAIGGVTDGARL